MSDQQQPPEPAGDDDPREDDPRPEDAAGAEAPDRDAGAGPMHPGAA